MGSWSAKATNPADTWLGADGKWADQGVQDAPFRHLRSANFAYLDGHAQANVFGAFSYHTGKAPWIQLGSGRVALACPSFAERGYETMLRIGGKPYGRTAATVLAAERE